MKRSVAASVVASLFVAGSLVSAAPANAVASAGASADCELTGVHCVTGTGQSENAGTSSTGGYAAAACLGGSNGAILIQVTCSVGGWSSTTSLPGPTGAAVVLAPTDTLARQPVCWSVVGFFIQPLGGVNQVSTSGCSIVSL